MALSILDGNQSATTLSTILSSGQHITAHTVVSLGTQAKTDILSAVSSGIAISGTVTANAGGDFANSIENVNDVGNVGKKIAVQLYDDNGSAIGVLNNPLPISGTVSMASQFYGETTNAYAVRSAVAYTNGGDLVEVTELNPLPINITDSSGNGNYGTSGSPLKVSGTVTIGAGTAQIGSVTASISNSVTIASLPSISGTVTANFAISSSAITSGSFTSLTSATLVPANTARKMATVYNLGAGQLFINAGATATTLGGGFMVALSSGDFYECNYTTTTLSAIFATAGTASWMSH